MRNFVLLLFIFLGFSPQLASASEIQITAPVGGVKLFANALNKFSFEVKLDGEDDRYFVYLDDQQIQMFRKPKAEYIFDRLPLGTHQFCIKVAYKDNLLTGLQQCVQVLIISPRHVNYGDWNN